MTLLGASYTVPFFWLALFTTDDLKEGWLRTDEGEVRTLGAVASRERALTTFRHRRERMLTLLQLLDGHADTDMAEYMDAFEAHLRKHVRPNGAVALDWEEIRWMGDPDTFDRGVRQLLEALEVWNTDVIGLWLPELPKRLYSLAEVRSGQVQDRAFQGFLGNMMGYEWVLDCAWRWPAHGMKRPQETVPGVSDEASGPGSPRAEASEERTGAAREERAAESRTAGRRAEETAGGPQPQGRGNRPEQKQTRSGMWLAVALAAVALFVLLKWLGLF